MGRGHQAVGAAGFLCFAGLAGTIAGHHLSPAELGCGSVVAGGASLLPDLDCPQSTIARSLGGPSQVLSYATNKLSGGHRKGTHSLLAVVLLGIGLQAALYSAGGRYVALGLVFFCTSLCLRLLTEAKSLVCASLAGIVALCITTVAPGPGWLLISVLAAYLSHLGADFITVAGVPLLWPFIRRSQKVAFIGHTESVREKVVARGCGLLAMYLLALTLFPMWQSAA
jgi:membrane-bound metal-dependent hydrolase YbcI (DUF457 family)